MPRNVKQIADIPLVGSCMCVDDAGQHTLNSCSNRVAFPCNNYTCRSEMVFWMLVHTQ